MMCGGDTMSVATMHLNSIFPVYEYRRLLVLQILKCPVSGPNLAYLITELYLSIVSGLHSDGLFDVNTRQCLTGTQPMTMIQHQVTRLVETKTLSVFHAGSWKCS